MPRDDQGHLVPGRISPVRPVPASIARPEYVGRPGPREFTGSDVYTPADVELIRDSGCIAAQAIEAVGAAIRPGVTTDELDRLAHDFLVAHDVCKTLVGNQRFLVQESQSLQTNHNFSKNLPDWPG